MIWKMASSTVQFILPQYAELMRTEFQSWDGIASIREYANIVEYSH